MSQTVLSTVLDAILVSLLLISCVTDWRERIIPHWLNITIAVLAPVSWWNHGFHLWPDVAWQIGLSEDATVVQCRPYSGYAPGFARPAPVAFTGMNR